MTARSRLSELVRESAGQKSARPRGQAAKHTGQGASRVPFALLVTGLIVGGLALLLLLNTASAANEVRRHELAGKDASVAARVQELQNAVAASAAPGNLAAAAAQLGMVPAGNPAFLVIGTNGAVSLLGHPAPASGAPIAAQIPHKAKKKKKATKTASKTASKATKSASSTAHRSSTSASKSSSTARGTKTSSSSTPSHPPASPTSTPTPTITLPGGTR